MKKFLSIIILFTALFSCSEPAPRIDHKSKIDTVATMSNITQDTTKLLISELPVQFEGTDVLIYAIEMVNLEGKEGYRRSGSSYYNDNDFASSYSSSTGLSGDFINLVFEDSTGNRKPLTADKMTITRVTFLKSIFDITKKGYLLYLTYDRDTNGDKRLNDRDLQALYISRVDGSEFQKVSRELHEFHDYTTIKESNLLYFRTLEDINKDGKLNNQDKFHHYKVVFDKDGYAINEYDPLDSFEK